MATAWQPTWGIWLGEITHDVFTPCPRYLREPISASGLPITTDWAAAAWTRLAATNKHLAKTNKSGTRAEVTLPEFHRLWPSRA